ncbi:hypothetical protein F4677DRAFT_378071 [Hypoxylon crocopeplum]|nr:hypothetical protein F4677DRAFT_378071 [Hypoxylon crocopeplum]
MTSHDRPSLTADPSETGKLKWVNQTLQSRGTHQPFTCYFCRYKKVKCSRERPQCHKCKGSQLPCGYPSTRRKVSHVALPMSQVKE